MDLSSYCLSCAAQNQVVIIRGKKESGGEIKMGGGREWGGAGALWQIHAEPRAG